MRCMIHLSDLSSVVGVCASCLREKLLLINDAQANLQKAQKQRRNPPPIVFPRSVSPYTSRQESDTAAWNLSHRDTADRRFYGTPQVGPSGQLLSWEEYTKKKKKKKIYGFSLFYHLFRYKSCNHLDCDLEPMASNSDDPSNATPSSLFSTILGGRREKKVQTTILGAKQRACRNCDIEISPARHSDDENEEHYHVESSGCSSQSSPFPKQTPITPATMPSQRSGGKTGVSRNSSGMTTFCLSPLVRASPNRRWNQKGMSPDLVYSGENTVPGTSHSQNATSFSKNRSRKLADFGRSPHNH